MSNQNSHLPISKIAVGFGNLGRTFQAFNFVRDVSNANSSVNISSADFIKAPGKRRPFVLNFFPVLCNQTGDCSTDVCSMTGEKVELAQQVYDITQCIASPIFKLEKDDVRLIDANWSFSNVMSQIIQSALPDFRRRLATAMVTRLYALSGVHTDGAVTKRVTTTNSANGVVNPLGKFEIEREYLDAGLGNPYLLGGSEVYNWQKMVAIGAPNASGQDIGGLSTANTYYDEGLSNVVNNDLTNGEWILSIDPSVFKFVSYSANSGIFTTGLVDVSDVDKLYQMNGFGNMLEGTYYDPATGFVYDLTIRYDCGAWHAGFKFEWDFIVLPDTVCGVQGLNGIMKWRTCPPLQVSCPAGSPIGSPAAAKTYEWTPTLADTPSISKITLGGVTWVSNAPLAITTLAQLAAALNEAYSPNNAMFTVNGAKIKYTGYTALTGKINDTVTVTFA